MKNTLKLTFFFAFTFFSNQLFSQQLPVEWIATFKAQGKNPDRIAAIQADDNGNIVVSGYAYGVHGNADMFALKYNAQGDTLWDYYYNGSNNYDDYVLAMDIDDAGNVFLTGKANGTGSFDQMVTIKLNSNGVEQWVNLYGVAGAGESQGNSIAADDSGNVYVAGYFDGISTTQDWVVVKYNSAGQIQWTDLMNTPANRSEYAVDVAVGANQKAVVCGLVYDSAAAGGQNILVKQYDLGGTILWTDTYTNPSFMGTDMPKGILYAPNGDIIVGGQSYSNVSSTDALAISYSPSGIRQWATVYSDSSTTNDEQVYAMTIDEFGNVYLAASDFSSHLIIRFNSNGTQGWKKSWSGPLPNTNEVLFDIASDGSGGIYTVGKGVYAGPNYFGNGGLDNLVVVKYSIAGDSLWTYRLSSSTDLSIGFGIDVRNGKVYAGGFKADTAYVDENLFTVVLDTSGAVQQEWEFNGEGGSITRGQVVRTDLQNNVYCAATIDRLYSNGQDVAIVKYDPTGNLLWKQYYTTPGWRNDTLTGMEIDQAGNLILSISSDTNLTGTGFRPTLVKMNSAGVFLDTIWYNSGTTGVSFANTMIVRSDGSVVIGGTASIIGGFLAYFDDQLNYQWTAQIDSTPFALTRVNSLALFPNGDIAVTGYSQPGAGGTGKLVVQRFETSGNRLWTTDINYTNFDDEGKDVTVSSSGEVAVTGSSGTEALLAQLDGTTGQVLWRAIYNPTASSSESGVKVRYAPGNSIVIISRGWSGSVARYYTAQFNKTTGIQEWTNSYDQTASDREPVDLIVESSGRVVTAGWRIQSASTNYDYVLVGYTSAGVLNFENSYTTANYNPDQLRSMTSDQAGDFIVTGESATEFFNDFLFQMVTIKYGGTPVGINEISALDEVVVYPNPSASGKYLFIDKSGQKGVSKARVFDASGKMIKEISNFDLHSEIDISQFPTGLYLFQYFRNDLPSGIIKLMKN